MRKKTQDLRESQAPKIEPGAESLECTRLRRLLANTAYDPEWYLEVRDLTGFGKQVVREPYHIRRQWKPKWGGLQVIKLEEMDRIIWERLDGGPPMTDATNLPTHIKMIKRILQAMLIIELKRCGLASYILTGRSVATSSGLQPYTKFTVLLDDKPLTQVVWADAILGIGEQVMNTASGKVIKLKQGLQTRHLSGKITIRLERQNQGFF